MSDHDRKSMEPPEKGSPPNITTTTTSPPNEDQPPTSTLKLLLLTTGLCLSVFMLALDNTILATAIPHITTSFSSISDIGFYASSYLLTTCAFQLVYGKLYTFYNIKLIYLVALAIFELGSLICAVAKSSTVFIVGRAVAGMGSAGIVTGAFLIVATSVPLRQRAIYTGLIGAMYGIGSVAGPLLGGVFTDNRTLTWRFCFWINLPFGVITVVPVVLFVHDRRERKEGRGTVWNQLRQLDLIGLVSFIPAVVCLLLVLQWGGTKYPWGNGRIIALLVMTVVLFVSFGIIQKVSGENATVPLRIFTNRNVWGTSLYGACLVGSFFLMLYYIPIWFQAIKGVSAVKSGVMNLPMILGYVIFSIAAGFLTSLLGQYVPWMYLSIVFMAIGSGLLSTLKVNSGHPAWIGYQFIFGAGSGLCMPLAIVAAQTSLPDADVPIGTALVMFMENLGASILVSVGQNVFTNQLVKNIGQRVPGDIVDPASILSAGATEFRRTVAQEYLPELLVAYNQSLMQTFYVSVAACSLATLGIVWVQWISVKKTKAIENNNV